MKGVNRAILALFHIYLYITYTYIHIYKQVDDMHYQSILGAYSYPPTHTQADTHTHTQTYTHTHTHWLHTHTHILGYSRLIISMLS